MSHIRQTRGHSRLANRAGGFGGLGDTDPNTGSSNKGGDTGGDSGIDQILSDLGLGGGGDTKTSTTPPLTTSTPAPATPSSIAAPSSPSLTTSSTSPPTSSTQSTTTTTTTHTTPVTPATPTTHSSLPITHTVSGTALGQDITITHVSSVTAQAAVAGNSTPAAALTSNSLVGPVVGGVAGGVVGLALLIFFITWFMRRRRPADQDAINFDPGTFRRSAVLITDPPTHQDTVNRGFNNPATPPAMVERRPIYTQASFDNTVGVGSPTSGSQLVFQAPYSPITASPNVTSPVSAYDHHSWGAAEPAPVLTRNLTRNPSDSSAHSTSPVQYAAYPAFPQPARKNSTTRNGQLAPPHKDAAYLDMERTTSVTPYQAEQYVQISKQLNTEVPRGLDTPTVAQIVAEKMDLPPLPPADDPFADGEAHEDEEAQEEDEQEEQGALPMVQDMSFPAPPSPVLSTHSRYARERVESMPPTLPEITLQGRVSVSSGYFSDASSPAAGQTVFMNASLGKGTDSPMGTSRFPVTPSPLASTFTVPSPPAAATRFPETAQQQQRPEPKKRQTVYSTVYDPEDAYGGI